VKKFVICSLAVFLCAILLAGSFRIQKDEQLFREAKIFIFDEEWDTALEKLDELLEDFPKSRFFAEALFYKATCLKEMEGNEIEALRTFKDYLNSEKRDRSLAEEAETSIIDIAITLYRKGRAFYLREVEERLVHEEKIIRYYAAFELSYIEDKEIALRAVPVLKRILREEDDERYRDWAEIALLRIDPDIVRNIEDEGQLVYRSRILHISVRKIGSEEDDFNLSIPWSLADLLFSVIPEQSRLSMKKQGVNIDKIISDLTKLKGSVFELKDDDEGIIIRIWIE